MFSGWILDDWFILCLLKYDPISRHTGKNTQPMWHECIFFSLDLSQNRIKLKSEISHFLLVKARCLRPSIKCHQTRLFELPEDELRARVKFKAGLWKFLLCIRGYRGFLILFSLYTHLSFTEKSFNQWGRNLGGSSVKVLKKRPLFGVFTEAVLKL